MKKTTQKDAKAEKETIEMKQQRLRLKIMTVEDFVSIDAFGSRERIEELFAGRKALSALDILELDIPNTHKLWAVLRETLIPARTLHLLAVEFARAALVREREAGREPDERCWRALDVKLAWLDGKASDEELDAAIADARDAAKAARDAANAADAATWAAARAAANAAEAATWAVMDAANAAGAAANATNAAVWDAWAAAWDADWAAARDADWAANAARDDARAAQVALVRRMLEAEAK